MPASIILSLEYNIAAAHRALTRARDEASNLSDLSLHDDLQLMLIELERFQVDLLRGRISRKRRYHPPRVSQTQED